MMSATRSKTWLHYDQRGGGGGGGGGWISIWNQGIEAHKIWNLGIEAQKIWNLGTEKISGIWDLEVLDIFFDIISFLNSYMGQKYPNINLFYKWTHKQRQDGQAPLP